MSSLDHSHLKVIQLWYTPPFSLPLLLKMFYQTLSFPGTLAFSHSFDITRSVRALFNPMSSLKKGFTYNVLIKEGSINVTIMTVEASSYPLFYKAEEYSIDCDLFCSLTS